MAGVSTEQSDKLNCDLNLVPFIDLLSTLVLFLLVTAVWLQISAIPASVESKTKGQASTVQKPEDRLQVRVTSHSVRLTWPELVLKNKGGLPTAYPKVKDGYDFEKISEMLKTVSENRHLVAAAVSADDDVAYGYLVQAIDAVKQGGFINVAMSTE
jgi:biopolymer transport protein ExbD